MWRRCACKYELEHLQQLICQDHKIIAKELKSIFEICGFVKSICGLVKMQKKKVWIHYEWTGPFRSNPWKSNL
jgi:acetoacetate decarboxylase